MKIAFVTARAPLGGVIISTSILYKQFKKEGHQVSLVLTADTLGDGVDLLDEMEIPYASPGAGEPSLRRRCDLLLDELKSYDAVIHAESPEASYCSPALPERTISIKIIRNTFEIAHGKPFCNQESLNGFICISPVVREMMMLYKPRVPVAVVPNATLFDYLGRRKPDTSDDTIRLVYLGRLNESHKGVDILPEVLAEAKRRGLKISLTIAGSGRDEDVLRARLAEQGGDVPIRRLNREESEKLLHKSDLLIVPSRFEAFGLTVIEGMATGCIPVCSSAPAFSWILGKHSETLQAASDCAVEYVDIISHLIDAPELQERIRAELYERQQKLFSPAALGKGYLRAIERFSGNETKPARTGKVVIPLGKKLQDFCWGRALHKIYMRVR